MKFAHGAWLDADPDPVTRAELQLLIHEDGDELVRRFDGHLDFGTAGIRGQLGAGPQRMNRVLVRCVAAAVGAVLRAHHGDDKKLSAVIGYDARHMSEEFATDTARVLAGMGFAVTIIGEPHPTPLLAFAVRHLNAVAGVMVTASHNPPADNGIKVYWGDGVQIIPPIDSEIADAMSSGGVVDPDSVAAFDDPRLVYSDLALVDAYIRAATSLLKIGSSRKLTAVYTPLHGVGAQLAEKVFTAAGFSPLIAVPEQVVPDPDFPTTPFPNPEEPGALDLARALADQIGADVVLAHDPDADRFAAVVPDGEKWRTLSGNEIGVLLADHLLRSGGGSNRLVVTTVVSSQMLSALARHHQVEYAETLTGFKWIMRPALARPEVDLVLGYEEALGFAFGDEVRDKDGITAMVLFAELVAELSSAGETVIDRLHELFGICGVHRTGQISLRREGSAGLAAIATAMSSLRSTPPSSVAGRSVTSVVDLAEHDPDRGSTDAMVLYFEGEHSARLVVRPSGTEPKLKLYGEVVLAAGDDVREAGRVGDQEVETLLKDLAEQLLPD
ncbi:MAG: hypothetical protein V3V01_09505 [Acidimicrobiales bacterium]